MSGGSADGSQRFFVLEYSKIMNVGDNILMIEDKYVNTIRMLDSLVLKQIVPGISYTIFDRQNEYRQAFGYSEVEPHKFPLKDGMQYDLASLTKVIATVPVIALLIQAGVLRLDDPVKKYLPSIHNTEVTVRNLITHTAAIEGYIPHRNELPKDQLLFALLHDEKIGPNLNKNICYTDIGFVYLGLIAEKICGMPIHRLSEEKIFRPLGLTRTTFTPHRVDAVPTEIQKQRGLIKGQVHDPKGYVLGAECGSAGLFSTLDDLKVFSRSLIERNLDNILVDRTVDLMFTDQTKLEGIHNRGLGWKLLHARTKDRHTVISHTGFTGTAIILDRNENQGLIILSNRVHPTANNDVFLDMRDQIMAKYMMEKEQ